MSFRLVPNSVTLNVIEGHIAPGLRYFTEFGSFRGALRKSGWRYTDRPNFCDRNVSRMAILASSESSV